MKLSVHVRTKPGLVQAFCPDLPGCSTTAATEAEALTLLRTEIAAYFRTRATPLPGTRVLELEV